MATRGGVAALAVVALAFGLGPGPAAAQIPDKFENLKVLPKDIAKRELIERMKSFCAALDVRCTHCHVGEEGAPLSELDFVSDDKHHKQVARVMMRMVDAINGTYLPEAAHHGSEPLEVSCVTCHRGQAKPRSLEDVLADVVGESGAEAGVARYRELRERHYGGGTFDFSARTLAKLAIRLADEKKVEAGIAFLQLNVELHPDDATSYYYLGELHAQNGAQAKAIASLEKALELQPENPVVKRKLEQLRSN